MQVKGKSKPKNKMKIKKNDQVVVISGRDAGKKGRVLRTLLDKNRVLVEGVMLMKKHVKPNPQRNIKGGIAEQEASIHVSNVMLIDSDGKKTRIGMRSTEDQKIRFARTNGAPISGKRNKT